MKKVRDTWGKNYKIFGSMGKDLRRFIDTMPDSMLYTEKNWIDEKNSRPKNKNKKIIAL